jgi:hypothetical protein
LTAVLATPAALQADGFEIDERGFNRTEKILSEVRDEYQLDQIPGGAAAENGYQLPISSETYRSGLSILATTHEQVRAAGGMYVLVNMPEHADKFVGHRQGEERYQDYVDALRTFAASEGIVFVDLVSDDLRSFGDDTMFADFNHMTPEAAERLSRILAEHLGRTDAFISAVVGD